MALMACGASAQQIQCAKDIANVTIPLEEMLIIPHLLGWYQLSCMHTGSLTAAVIILPARLESPKWSSDRYICISL